MRLGQSLFLADFRRIGAARFPIDAGLSRAVPCRPVAIRVAISGKALCTWAAQTRSVAALYVFGSFARGAATHKADLDIALELASNDGDALAELIDHAAAWKAELSAATGILVKDIYLASDPCTAGKVLIFKRGGA